METYLNYNTPEETFKWIKKLFKEQGNWGKQRLSQIPHIAKDYGFSLQAQNRKQAIRIDEEVHAVNITNVPTIFVGETAFVETIDLEAFKKAVENELE